MAAIDILRDILAKRKKPGEVKAEKLPLGTVADLSPRQEETVTLGGTEEVPLNNSLAAVRPRDNGLNRQQPSDEWLKGSGREKVYDAATGQELTPEMRDAMLRKVAIEAARTGRSGTYSTSGVFQGDGEAAKNTDSGSDEETTDWDTWVREVDAGLRTPPFVSTPGYEAARRRQSGIFAQRPRVVPDQPVNADVPRPPMPRELDNGGAFDVGVPYADVLAQAPQAPQTPPNLNDPRQRAKYLESKQYNPGEYRKRDGSITNNPNDPDVVETVREPGKDRDKKWSLGEKIGSFFLGMFDGTGAIPAAMDRNYLERRQDRRELADTYGTIQRQQAVEKGDLANQEQVLQNDYLAMRPQIEQQKVDVAADRVGVAARRADIAERTQGWKEEDRKKYWEWEEIKLKAKQESDARTFALAERKQAKMEEDNKIKNDLAARRVAVQERKAGLAVENAKSRSTTGGGKKGQPPDPRRLSGWMDYANKLDDKFNNGEIDKETYDRMVQMMSDRMKYEFQR